MAHESDGGAGRKRRWEDEDGGQGEATGYIRIGLGSRSVSSDFVYHFPKSIPFLAHLSLRGVRISDQHYDKYAGTFDALEAIHLDSVVFDKDPTLSKMVVLCPHLRVLDLRRCGGVGSITFGRRGGGNLRSLTVAECRGDIRLDRGATASSLTDAECRGVTGLDAAAANSCRPSAYWATRQRLALRPLHLLRCPESQPGVRQMVQ